MLQHIARNNIFRQRMVYTLMNNFTGSENGPELTT